MRAGLVKSFVCHVEFLLRRNVAFKIEIVCWKLISTYIREVKVTPFYHYGIVAQVHCKYFSGYRCWY